MIKAVIDVGTNSVKLCIADVEGGDVKVLRDVSSVKRLGEKMRENGFINEEALERNARCVREYVDEAKEARAERITIVGTMALRSATNSFRFKKRVKELTNLDVDIISGDEEARLSYLAAISGIPGAASSKALTFDTGGGSTEFVFGENGRITFAKSVNIGAVRITEEYFSHSPLSREELAKGQSAITREISDGGISVGGALLIGMGGNITSMAAIKQGLSVYDAEKVQGFVLSLADVDAQIADFASKTFDERRKIVGLDPDRAEIILAGACIVRAAMSLCGAGEVVVSDRGLRHVLMTEEGPSA
ncbi:MAG: Ppx/GppA phosphatase family protein [Synergistaceae bacterium]|nr:Ppx/GppA phosphatase family protein [Synergistaceae bacterium]